MSEPKKQRANKYEKKVDSKDGFGDVIKVAVMNMEKPKEKAKKKKK